MSFLYPNLNDEGLLKPTQNNLRERTADDKKTILTLLLLSLLIVIINIPRCFYGDLWYDELASIEFIHLPYDEMIQHDVMHPPLYYMVLRAFVDTFGDSVFLYHFVSLLFFFVILVLCSTVVYAQFGKKVALFTIGFSALVSLSLVNIVEVRMYELAAMFTFISFLAFYQILQYDRKIDWIIFVISSVLAASSFYYCLLAVGFLYLMLLMMSIAKKNERKNNDLRRTVISIVVSVVCYSPVVFLLLNGLKSISSKGFWIAYVDPLSMVVCLFGFAGIVVTPIFIYLCYKALKSNHADNRNKGMGWFKLLSEAKTESLFFIGGLLAIFGTILVVVVISLVITPMTFPKYVFPYSVIAWLLLSILISRLDLKAVNKKISALFVVSIVVSAGFVIVYEKVRNDSMDCVLNDTKEICSDNVLITNHDHFEYIFGYYYPGAKVLYDSEIKIPSEVTPGVHWIFSEGDTISKKVVDELEQHGCKAIFVTEGCFTEDLYVYVYKIGAITDG